MTGKNRIMIYGPKDDGTYVVEFRTVGERPRRQHTPRDARLRAVARGGDGGVR
jgi:hypothetical protein